MSHRLSVPFVATVALLALAVLVPAPLAGGGRTAVEHPPLDAAAQRVEFTVDGEPTALLDAVVAVGGAVEVLAPGRVQALLPAGADTVDGVLDAAGDGVRRTESPAFLPLQIADVGEAGRQIGVDRWQAAGFSGHGTRIAIVDTGFVGYEGLLGNGLPASVHARSFRADGSMRAGSDHGTRAAEIVHRVAPGADLYLLTFATLTELSALVDFVVAEQIDIVSFSIGFIHSGPGNGTGPVDAIVSRAIDSGVLWVSAAGNWAQQHWSGPFTDTDGDGVHEFAPGEQGNGRHYVAGDLVIVSLRWDAPWGAACSDYDIELFGPDGALVRAARGIQTCQSDPVEGLRVLATTDGHYTARIVRAEASRPHELSLLMLGSPDRLRQLDRSVALGSLAQPADHPGVLAVGAANADRREAGFSSRGISAARLKPEVLSPTVGVAPALGTAFSGTSAAAPHVAAAAALLGEALWYPAADALRGELLARAAPNAGGRPVVDLGSLSGLGRLLPVGAEEAFFAGEPPGGPGLAIAQYRGPDGYPPRFLHRLLDGRTADAVYRVEIPSGRWTVYLRGAPDFVNSLRGLNNGDIVIVSVADD